MNLNELADFAKGRDMEIKAPLWCLMVKAKNAYVSHNGFTSIDFVFDNGELMISNIKSVDGDRDGCRLTCWDSADPIWIKPIRKYS